MTANEAALGLASAHRPQFSGMIHNLSLLHSLTSSVSLPADGARIPQDIAQASVVPPPPEAVATPSSRDATSTKTSAGSSEPLVPSNDEKEEPEGSVSTNPPPDPPLEPQ